MTEPLSYESRHRGPLDPDERVLWQSRTAGPTTATLRRHDVVCYVTDRRALRFVGSPAGATGLQQREPLSVEEVALLDVSFVSCRVGWRHAQITVHGDGEQVLTFEKVREWREPATLIAAGALAARVEQGIPIRRRRREGRHLMHETPTAFPASPHAEAPPKGMALLDGERVLWTGRPRPRDPFNRAAALRFLRSMGWLCVPGGILLAKAWDLGKIHTVLLVIAAVWLAIGLWSQTVGRLLSIRRRRHTFYVLADLRAISVYRAGSRAHFRSGFLDLAATASLDRNDADGHGNVTPGPLITFESIPDAAAVHTLACEAIARAGEAGRAAPQAN